jgi:ribosomal protein S18 acetylase RimI-like enzyme
MPRPATSTTVRSLIPSDLRSIGPCEAPGDFDPWEDDRIATARRKHDTVGYLMADGGRTIAYALLALKPDRLVLRRLAVRPDLRGSSVGARLLGYIVDRKISTVRPAVEATVHEQDDAAIGWLRACGFRAVGVEPGRFGKRDGYRFEMYPRE